MGSGSGSLVSAPKACEGVTDSSEGFQGGVSNLKDAHADTTQLKTKVWSGRVEEP